MKLGTEISWHDRRLRLPLERIRLSERWGYDAVFSAEGQGSDALTPLAYVAAVTNRLALGTCILPVTARPPAVAAQSFQTLDQLAGGGRVMIGLGSANPQAAEGWAGAPFGSRVERMRDYVAVMRAVASGGPVDYAGKALSVPYRGAGARGGAPVTSGLDTNPEMPIFVGCLGPKMIALAAEIADGWMPTAFNPRAFQYFKPMLEEGFARAGSGKGYADFQIWAHLDVMVDDDVRAAMRPFKAFLATYIDYLRPTMDLLGLKAEADRVAELTAAGRFEDAVEAIPDDYIDSGWLCGPLPRIREQLQPWLSSGATGLIVRYGPQVGANRHAPENLEAFRVIAHALEKPGA